MNNHIKINDIYIEEHRTELASFDDGADGDVRLYHVLSISNGSIDQSYDVWSRGDLQHSLKGTKKGLEQAIVEYNKEVSYYDDSEDDSDFDDYLESNEPQ